MGKGNYVLHTIKLKSKDVRGMDIHNERKSENSSNPDIQKDLSHLNYELHDRDENISYDKQVKSMISERYEGRKLRDNTTFAVSIMVSSGNEFFEGMSQEREREFFKANYDLIAEKYGKENIVSAKVHKDEKTPHMHLIVVPFTKDNRLSAKELFDRDNLRELQDFATKLQEKGFDIERGKDAKGKNKHLETNKFKAQEIKSAILEIEKEISGLEKNKKDLEKKLENNSYLKNSDTFHIQKYEAINKSKGVIFKEKAKTILVPEEEMRELIDIANSRIYAERDIKNLEIEKSNLEAKLENSHDFNRVSMNLIDSIEFNKKNLSKEKYQEFLEMTFNPMINNKPEQIQKNICEAFVNAGNKIKKDFAKNTDFVNDLGQILIKSIKNYEKNKELKNAKEKTRYKNLGINR